ncbi:MAG: class I SAM-dependent methyltransferase [Cyanobacteria bacterium P01_G01_bin.39]
MSNFQNLNQSPQDDAYDRWHESVHGEENPIEINLSSWHKTALNLSPPLENLNILEVGCGVGDFALHLVNFDANVTAVDFSPHAIEIAKKKSTAQNKSVNFRVADAQSLPFADNSFDLLLSCECLEHVPEPQLALNEFKRVLKPQGKLVLTTENYSNAMVLYWLKCWIFKKPFNSGAGVQPIEHFFLYWRVKRMFHLSGFQVQNMVGWHHVFLLLPKLHPHTFVVEKFKNSLLVQLFKPFARHIAFEAIKSNKT